MRKTLIASLLTSFLISPSVIAEIKLKGHLQQGGLLYGKAKVGSTVTLNDKPIEVSEDGYYVFGFGRDANEAVTLVVTQKDGKSFSKTMTPSPRKYKEDRIEGIAKKIMNPNPKHVARAKKDSTQVKAARTISRKTTDFVAGFIAPIDGRITGVYGSRRIFNGVPKRPHFGLDYAGKVGDPVMSPADGKVVMYVPDMFYSGGTMIIEHGMGVSSTFLHLSDSYVKVGDLVKKGQNVAAVGKSGRATGPHLDWRINWFGTKIDPQLVLSMPDVK